METSLKIDFASFQNFSREYQATQLPKSREIRWELKGEDRFRVQIYRLQLLFLFSAQLKAFGHFTSLLYRDGKESYKKVQLAYLLL